MSDNRLTAEQIEELQKSRSRDDDYDVIVPGSAVPLNASDVEKLVSFYVQDINALERRIIEVKARCTHVREDGSSACVPMFRGVEPQQVCTTCRKAIP